MNKPTFCLLTALTVLCTFSCKKQKKTTTKPTIDSPTIDSPVTYDDYTALKPGNYWIYQDYRLDSANGTAHALGTYDSSYVEKDTIINGHQYHKYRDATFMSSASSPTYNIYYLRDSLSYTVNLKGEIIFSSEDFTSVFRTFSYGPNAATPDTLTVTEQMGFKDAAVTVDAGTFITSTFRQIYHFPAGYPFGGSREYDHRYAKNIGLISEITGFYTATPEVYERRLVRYHLQ